MTWARAIGSLLTRPERAPISETERRLLDAVIAEPDDNGPRTVYADWLCAHGDPALAARGELINVQCALEAIADPAEHSRLKARDFALVERWGSVWCAYAGLGEVRNNWYDADHEADFERGFIETASLWLADYPRVAVQLFTNEPVRGLVLLGMQREVLARLPTSVYVRRLRSLALRQTRITPAELRALVEGAATTQLHRLVLGQIELGVEHCSALAGARIRELAVPSTSIDADGVAELARIASLTVLELDDNPIGDAGARALIDSSLALERLSLVDVQLGATTLAALRARFPTVVTGGDIA